MYASVNTQTHTQAIKSRKKNDGVQHLHDVHICVVPVVTEESITMATEDV